MPPIPARPRTWPPPNRSGSTRSGPSSRVCARADPGLTRQQESAETRERLQALGYLSRAAPSPVKRRYTDADDPKRLTQLDNELQEVVTLYQAGDIGSAMLKAQQVVAQRPDMALALQHLGFLQREAGELEAAVATLKRAVAASPDDASVAALLGAYLHEAGHSREAADVSCGSMPSVPIPTWTC